jgi:hypothetical protein
MTFVPDLLFRTLHSDQRCARKSRLCNWLPAICVAFLSSTTWAPACTAQTGPIDQVSADLNNRSPAIHWPARPNPNNASAFAHNEIVINAGCAEVWALLIDAKA